ncbi:Tetraspanin8 [Heracleum sosnowskyi]|uniref:Tetraspanin8 n=1 Tax=Heracleum sosnowskyi TaxID=360622 RepID=A0AAD8MP57_9APIA|nr:Tetraspanin8 [Heracleum sosnowskyi]
MRIQRTPENVTAILILGTFFFSTLILYCGLWISYEGISCDNYFETNLKTLAYCLMFVSTLGFVGALCRSSPLVWLYVLLEFVLIFLVLLFMAYGLYVTFHGPVTRSRVHRLEDYSRFFRKRVENERDWEKVKTWLQVVDVCTTVYLPKANREGVFQMEHLSTIRAGCCKPSNLREDRKLWDNDPKVMCFNCLSCKANLLDTMRSDLKKVVALCTVFLMETLEKTSKEESNDDMGFSLFD